MPTEETLRIFDEKCKKGKHPLDKIFSASADFPGGEYVVRWCPICGTVVIDTDCDGRVAPGRIMKARKPKMLEK